MAHAVRIHQVGGPEVLRYEEVPVGEPGPGQARIRITAAGVNFVDVYHRTGLYPLPLPAVLGVEAAGRIEAIGPGVTGLVPGDRVTCNELGCYADARLVAADRLVKLPGEISERDAAAVLSKGLTVHMLIRKVRRIEPGDVVLWHAAAGGVGLLAVQWLKAVGATVIGTVGSDAKAEVARAHGCDHVIVYTREDFVKRVRELTGGEGVSVVYDAVGKTTFAGSLDCLRPFGLMVTFGNASGPVPPVDPLLLSRKGSLALTRPSVFTYVARPEVLRAAAAELFDVVRSGRVKVEIGRTWPLAEAAEAHRALEARATTGSTVLLP